MSNSVLWTPLLFGVLGLFVPRRWAGWVVTLGAAVTLALAIAMLAGFDSGQGGLQETTDVAWISGLGVRYSIGIDGLNVFLVLLTAVLWLPAVAFAAFREPERPHTYFLMLALAETATLGAFLAQDLLLFVLFFDLMLIPFYFLFGIWGSDRPDGVRASAATLKMIIYTLVGSLLMFAAAIATAILAADGGQVSFSIADLQQNILSEGSQRWIFWFFAAAFLVKMPAFLLHGWMPDAYRAAPLPALAVFSGVLAKVGAYGFLRIVLPLFPDATIQFQEVVLLIALASILYGSVMAFTQTNVRLIAGYSSIAQLGFITAGIFALRPDGADGALLQMVNHGLVVAPVILIIALLAERTGAGDAVPDRRPRNPGDARVGQLHRRVLHPQRPLPGQDRVRLRRRLGDRVVRLLRPAPVPAHDARPKAGTGAVARAGAARRGGAGAAGGLHRRARLLPTADPPADRQGGERERRGGGRGAF
jgi:NADH-quinone oxidoreductase subunit M